MAGEPDTRDRIMWATYRVLWRHGYAGLSIGRIAEAADLSKSSLYNHFDDKDALLLGFLRFMLDRFRDRFEADTEGEPMAQLRSLVDTAVTGRPREDPRGVPEAPGEVTVPWDREGEFDGGPGFGALVELRAQAVANGDYRAEFARIDAVHRESIAGIVERGVESGRFREVDPDSVAELLFTAILGGIVRRTTAEESDLEPLRQELYELLDRRLFPAE